MTSSAVRNDREKEREFIGEGKKEREAIYNERESLDINPEPQRRG